MTNHHSAGPSNRKRRGMVALAVAAAVILAGPAQAAPVAYTDAAAFLAALTGPAVTETFDSLAAGINEQQRFQLNSATGGSFELLFDGGTSDPIPYNASAAAFQAGLETLPAIGTGDVAVSGSAGDWTVEFTRALGSSNQPFPGLDGAGLSGPWFAVITGTQPGTANTSFPTGNGPGIVNFDYNLGRTDLSVGTAADAVSGANILRGLQTDDGLTVSLDTPVNALGMYVLASGPLSAGDVSMYLNRGTNEHQRMQLSSATGGTFELTFEGETTDPIAFDASPLEVQAALSRLATVGAGGVRVTGGPSDWNIEFAGALGSANQPFLGVDGDGLSGPWFAVLNQTQAGSGSGPFTAANALLPPDGTNERQRMQLTSATGGTFQLIFDGETTDPIAFNASAAAVEAALEALATVGEGGVSVTGSAGDWEVEFTGALGSSNQPFLGVDGDGLSGPWFAVLTQTQAGASGDGPYPYFLGIIDDVPFSAVDLGFDGAVARTFVIDDLTHATTSIVAAPEPATLALFGLGLAGLGFARRRKAA